MKSNTLIDLLDSKVISVALQPSGNPQKIRSPQISATFIEHDYPGKTPSMWNAVYKTYGINAQSIMFVGSTDRVSEIARAAKHDKRYVGGGMGVGFKDVIIDHLDELDPLAKAIGAVNVVVKTEQGLLRGHNTDGIGYRESLSDLLKKTNRDVSDTRILILGAGGTGNAIAMALGEAGAKLTILNRTVEKAVSLCNRVNEFVGKQVAFPGSEEDITEAASKSDVIINVSTKGAAGKFEKFAAFAPADIDRLNDNLGASREILLDLPKNVIVSDIILGEKMTPTLSIAQDVGLTTLDGIPMVINQGVEAIWIVHGKHLQDIGAKKDDVRRILKLAF